MSLIQKTSTVISKPKTEDLPFKPLAMTGDEIAIPIYQFVVLFGGVAVALFQNVTGMSFSREVEPLTVGGENDFGREFPGHVSYGHITLEVGLSRNDFFWQWMKAGEFAGYAVSMDFTLEQRRPQPDDTITGDQEIYEVVKNWDFYGAFPVSWKISDLAIDNSENVVIETLELSYDYFDTNLRDPNSPPPLGKDKIAVPDLFTKNPFK